MSDKILPLIRVKDAEPNLTWESICQSPALLINAIASLLAVDAKIIGDYNTFIISDTVPSSDDRKKIWIKTSWPYAIGKVIDGEYKMDYGLSGFVPNQVFLYDPSAHVSTPEKVRVLTDVEVTDYGLTNTDAAAEKRLRWAIFEPDEITF